MRALLDAIRADARRAAIYRRAARIRRADAARCAPAFAAQLRALATAAEVCAVPYAQRAARAARRLPRGWRALDAEGEPHA